MNYLFVVFSGMLIGSSLEYPDLYLLSWIGLIPLIYVLDKRKSSSFKLGWSFGLAMLIVSGRWLVYPLLNFSGFPIWLSYIITILALALIAIYFGLFAALLELWIDRLKIPLLISFPILWTGIEILRSKFSFGYLFGFLGYSQSFKTELIQFASYGGVYLISFLVVLVNVLLYLSIRDRRLTYLLIAVLIFSGIFSYGIFSLQQEVITKKTVKLGVIQPNIAQNIKMDSKMQNNITKKILNLSTKELNKDDLDLLIWPETAILRSYSKDEGFPFYLPKDTPLFIGGFTKKGDEIYNSSFLFGKQRKIIDSYSKHKLVPFGEYMPFPQFIPNIIKKNMNDLDKGKELSNFELNGFNWISPICSEILDSDFVRKLYNQEDIIINISNEAWFGKSSAPVQILQSAIFRAVEYQVPVVKIANTGISGIVNSKGKVLTKTKLFETMSFNYELSLLEQKESFYYKFGNALEIIFLIFICLISIIDFAKNT
ncbi:apolipoprotein N-acyltransferase [Orenia metallireducens]|uniref:Apolipoprotein N-acyltransferase n=1 Tax=Orenia metallireducens TaxID=1413210 RepID=A0A285IGK8_9FIRM|nr:apolipoprotein N-acyltransferase [Orenia metallireducens]PRX19235.1 apolipoprotein N-acyltransferase [Orenia metallireducens]SNY46216.1 Apolipoprotein N-acyltransferase [Orenia metallireducens]